MEWFIFSLFFSLFFSLSLFLSLSLSSSFPFISLTTSSPSFPPLFLPSLPPPPPSLSLPPLPQAGQFLLAFGVEALSLLRRRIFKKFEVIPQEQRNFYKFIMFSLHILQALVGYLIMLGAMTYSVEVLVSVVLGLGVGYLVFNSEFPVTAKAEPCCMENYNSVN